MIVAVCDSPCEETVIVAFWDCPYEEWVIVAFCHGCDCCFCGARVVACDWTAVLQICLCYHASRGDSLVVTVDGVQVRRFENDCGDAVCHLIDV